MHLVAVSLSTHFLSWGNKGYLLREFSIAGQSLGLLWQRSLATRGIALALPFALMVVLGDRVQLWPWLALWLVLALVYQSLDVVVLYLHRFRLAIAAELAALAFTVSLLLHHGDRLDESTVIMAFVLGLLVKTGILLIALWSHLFPSWGPRVERRHIVAAAPFFLIGFSGMLQSKIDLYAAAFFLTRAEVGRYQVTINLFIALQAVAAFVVMPFIKDIYRSDDKLIHEVSRKLGAGGVVIAILSVPAAILVLERLYGFELPWSIFVVGALAVPPIFRYVPLVYLLYKHGLERHVVQVSFFGAGVNLVLALLLMPRLGMLGALIAAATAQWAMMVWYLSTVRRIVKQAAR